jgi:hypothetical protein
MFKYSFIIILLVLILFPLYNIYAGKPPKLSLSYPFNQPSFSTNEEKIKLVINAKASVGGYGEEDANDYLRSIVAYCNDKIIWEWYDTYEQERDFYGKYLPKKQGEKTITCDVWLRPGENKLVVECVETYTLDNAREEVTITRIVPEKKNTQTTPSETQTRENNDNVEKKNETNNTHTIESNNTDYSTLSNVQTQEQTSVNQNINSENVQKPKKNFNVEEVKKECDALIKEYNDFQSKSQSFLVEERNDASLEKCNEFISQGEKIKNQIVDRFLSLKNANDVLNSDIDELNKQYTQEFDSYVKGLLDKLKNNKVDKQKKIDELVNSLKQPQKELNDRLNSLDKYKDLLLKY